MVVRTSYSPVDMNAVVGTSDLVFLVLDTLRFDVADEEFRRGGTPNFARCFPEGWEKRHSPGSFTLAAHQAFFAGFLPTPADPTADKTRLFACRFEGSETAGGRTKIVEADNWIRALEHEGYQTMCIGGVGFFNMRTPLSRHLTGYFAESAWKTEFGVTCQESTEHQFRFAENWLANARGDSPVLLYINVSAIHQPNYFYSRRSGPDDMKSHAAALRYVDSKLPVLVDALKRRNRPGFLMTMSDHGTAYGEDGWTGHRLAHEVTWEVPYAHGFLS